MRIPWFPGVRVLLCAAILPCLLCAQIPSTSVRLQDWGVARADSIRWGRISVVRSADRVQTVVQALYDSDHLRRSAGWKSAVPAFEGERFLLTDFATGGRNRLGGGFGTFQQAPSSANAVILREGEPVPALRFTFERREAGYCGVWIHLFETGRPSHLRTYLDSTPFTRLEFRVRSTSNAPAVSVKMADAAQQEREDALELGPLEAFSERRKIDAEWQRIVIPLMNLPERLDRRALASIVLEPAAPEAGSLDVGAVFFSHDTSVDAGPVIERPRVITRPGRKALWVWNTEELLADSAQASEFLSFASHEALTDVFLAVPPGFRAAEAERTLSLQTLIGRLSRSNVQTHALIGDPGFILPNNRPVVDSLFSVLSRFNASGGEGEKFVGLHLDVEPYLLPGFGSRRVSSILLHYLAHLESASAFCRRENLVFGVDIPFWFDEAVEQADSLLAIDFRGMVKPLYEHVIDIADLVVIMGYRTETDGADGIVAHVERELAYAAAAGTPVMVGLETEEVPDEDLYVFSEAPVRGVQPVLRWSGQVLCLPHGDSASFWIVGMNELPEFELTRASLGVPSYRVLAWPRPHVTRVSGSKLSFGRLGAERLADVVRTTAYDLSLYPSFAGFAYHHYQSYRRLLRSDSEDLPDPEVHKTH